MGMILQADPKAAYLAHQEEIDEAVRVVLDSGWYILGSAGVSFEKEFAAFMGAAFAIGVGTGTDAIQVALRACGIGPGDVVATVSHTAIATVAAIDMVGATPLLVDIDPVTFTMDATRLEDTLKTVAGRDIKALVPVHLYGHPADMEAILDIARRFSLHVIEDCAQSHGAQFRGQMTGTLGHFGAFSFYPTKNLGALGDGGACVCNDSALAEKARLIRQYGWKQRYISDIRGTNTRLDELQAAILRVKLRYLNSENERRRWIASQYSAALGNLGWTLPCERKGAKHVFHQYTVRVPQRDEIQRRLHERGIGTAILYPFPAHQQPGYADRIRIGAGGLYQSEAVCRDLLCLPVYPQLSDGNVQQIIQSILDCVASRG